MSRERRSFSPEFKLQMVKLYENGKPRNEIVREYELTSSALGTDLESYKGRTILNRISGIDY